MSDDGPVRDTIVGYETESDRTLPQALDPNEPVVAVRWNDGRPVATYVIPSEERLMGMDEVAEWLKEHTNPIDGDQFDVFTHEETITFVENEVIE